MLQKEKANQLNIRAESCQAGNSGPSGLWAQTVLPFFPFPNCLLLPPIV